MNEIKFILLTETRFQGKKHLIRVDKIEYIIEDWEVGSKVFLDGPVSRIEVREKPEEILRLIKGKLE